MASLVHWHEGLFLQAHHLQRSQKGLLDLVSGERRMAWAYPYGVVSARLNPDDLENFRLRFDYLRAIMPSGIEVNFPGDAELPAIDIKQLFSSRGGTMKIFLGVPLWFEARANTAASQQEVQPKSNLLYRLAEVECADENTGENRKPLLLRRINARLLLEDEDDFSDLEFIPLLQLVQATGQNVGLPRQDSEYCGPCLVLGGSPNLMELVRDLASQVDASRKKLLIQMTRGGFSLDNLRGAQFEQMMRLRTLNRFSARLPSLAVAPNTAPFTMYLELRELLGELTALHPDRDVFDVPAYDHDNPYLIFAELSVKIRSLLGGAVAPSYMEVPFNRAPDWFTAVFEDKHFSQPNDYFLGIETKEDPRVLAKLVEDPDRFKLMPRSMASRAVRGVFLKEDRFVPLELPAKSGLHYFRLLRSESAQSSRSWEMIQLEKSAVIRWLEEDKADYQMKLYMTVPAGSAPDRRATT